MRAWLKNLSSGGLILLGLVGFGVPPARAQMQYDGAYIPASRFRRGTVAPARYAPHPPMQFNLSPAPSLPPGATMAVSFTSERASPRVTGENPYRIPAGALPWNRTGFVGYDETGPAGRSATAGRVARYKLRAVALSRNVAIPDRGVAVLVAHLPASAAVWIEGKRTLSTGKTRYFESPPLPAGKKYRYTLYVAWFEGGHMVGQSVEIPVDAGHVGAVYLAPASPPPRQTTAR